MVADLAAVAHTRVEEVLDIVELRSRAGRRFGTYTTGMKQRLGVAAALLNDLSKSANSRSLNTTAARSRSKVAASGTVTVP